MKKTAEDTARSDGSGADHRQIERFLRRLRQSHEHMAGVFTHGGCYELFRILETIWPEARPS